MRRKVSAFFNWVGWLQTLRRSACLARCFSPWRDMVSTSAGAVREEVQVTTQAADRFEDGITYLPHRGKPCWCLRNNVRRGLRIGNAGRAGLTYSSGCAECVNSLFQDMHFSFDLGQDRGMAGGVKLFYVA